MKNIASLCIAAEEKGANKIVAVIIAIISLLIAAHEILFQSVECFRDLDKNEIYSNIVKNLHTSEFLINMIIYFIISMVPVYYFMIVANKFGKSFIFLLSILSFWYLISQVSYVIENGHIDCGLSELNPLYIIWFFVEFSSVILIIIYHFRRLG